MEYILVTTFEDRLYYYSSIFLNEAKTLELGLSRDFPHFVPTFFKGQSSHIIWHAFSLMLLLLLYCKKEDYFFTIFFTINFDRVTEPPDLSAIQGFIAKNFECEQEE